MMKSTLQFLFQTILLVFASSVVSAQTLYDDLKSEIDITVAQDGSGDYKTVMEAINAAPSNSTSTVLIFIKNGSYYEKIIIPNDKPNLTLIGENVDKTILWYDQYSKYTIDVNTFTCHSVRVDANDVKIMNLTIDNPATSAQAIALHGNGDHQTFAHCRVTGFQDTYYSDMRSRNYFKDCFIQGRTDYIFGFGVALFDSCQVHQIGASVITAASTPEDYKYGFVFRNSVFATPAGANFQLGRPWFDYAKTVLINCYEDGSLNKAGWSDWDGRGSTCYYREYKCFGPGSATADRISFSGQLTDTEAAEYTTANILSADNFNHTENVGTAEAYFTTGPGKDQLASKGLTWADILAKEPEIAELGAGDADMLKYFYRWTGHAGEPYLDEIVWRQDGSWPVKPTTDWMPDIDSDPYYLILKKHTKMFLDSANTRMGDFKLLANGEAITDFDPEVTLYGVELASGATDPANLTLEGDAFALYTYPKSVPGFSIADVSPYNRIGTTKYKIYNSVDSAYWDSSLADLTIGGQDVLVSGVLEYDTIMALNTKSVPLVKATKTVNEASIKFDRNKEIPGTTYIYVVAPNGEDSSTYMVNFKFPLGLSEDLEKAHVRIVNPVSDEAIVKFGEAVATDVKFSIYATSGQLIQQQLFKKANIQNGELRVNLINTNKGLYLIRLEFNDKQLGGKLIIE